MKRYTVALLAGVTMLSACAQQHPTAETHRASAQRQTPSEEAQWQQRAAQARAQAQQQQAQGKLASTDQQFLNEAARDGALEVKLGSLAMVQGTTPAVQQLGDRLMKDHTKANEELQKLVDQQGWRIPLAPADGEQTMRQLSQLSGREFERAYLQRMVEDHQKDLAAFEREVDEGQNPAVKAWVAQVVPQLREHLNLVQKTVQELSQQENAGAVPTAPILPNTGGGTASER